MKRLKYTFFENTAYRARTGRPRGVPGAGPGLAPAAGGSGKGRAMCLHRDYARALFIAIKTNDAKTYLASTWPIAACHHIWLDVVN
jgi:hypothetical protein